MLLLRPTRPTVAITPAVAAGLVAGAALLLWVQQQVAAGARREYFWLNNTAPADAFYRSPDYRSMSAAELQRLSQYLDWYGASSKISQPSGVLIDRRAINDELLRRSGRGGFIFIPPAAPVVVAAWPEVAAFIVGLAGFIWSLRRFFDWGPVNTKSGVIGTTVRFAPGSRVQATAYRLTEIPAFYECGSDVLVEDASSTLEPYEEDRIAQGTYKFFPEVGYVPNICGSGDNNINPAPMNVGFVNLYDDGSIGGGWYSYTGRTMEGPYYSKIPVKIIIPITSFKVNGKEIDIYGEPKDFKPQPIPALPLIQPMIAPQPEVLPEPQPEVLPLEQPEPAKTVPLPLAPPATSPGTAPKVPLLPSSPNIRPDGTPKPADPLPIVVTEPGSIVPWPGAAPIPATGTAPRPDLQGVAVEVGRLERKMEFMNTPNPARLPAGTTYDLADMLADIFQFLQGIQPGGAYEMSSPCVPDGDPGSVSDPLIRTFPPTLGAPAGTDARLEALAGLMQDAKNLPQPNCKGPKVAGEWVSVQFESEQPPPGSRDPIVKRFRYLDQNAGTLEAHVDHWRDFSWNAGPFCVIHKGGAWGVPQVWAASAAEGKRVIAHAAAIAGVDLNAKGSEWIVTRSSAPRYGLPGLMRVRRGRDRIWMVSKREGPDGPGTYLAPAGPIAGQEVG